MATLRILVFGSGAVGLGLLSCLMKSRQDVAVIGRPDTVRALRRSGLKRTGIFGEYVGLPVTMAAEHVDQLRGGPFDYILVCVKSFDSEQVAQDLARTPALFHKTTGVVLCQNGWGNAETFAQHLPDVTVLNARVITGFEKLASNITHITVHAQPITVGSIFDATTPYGHDLCDAISEGDIPSEPTLHISRDLWAKMCYNCALNPLGAVLGSTYGQLGASPSTRAVMDDVIEETFAVMQAHGLDTHAPDAKSYRRVFYDKLVPATASHRSSMLQDIRAGRRTEIDALNGQVVKLGHQAEVPTPTHAALCHMLHFLQDRMLSQSTAQVHNPPSTQAAVPSPVPAELVT